MLLVTDSDRWTDTLSNKQNDRQTGEQKQTDMYTDTEIGCLNQQQQKKKHKYSISQNQVSLQEISACVYCVTF